MKHKCPSIIANSKDGLVHKDKYLDTRRPVIRNAHVQYEISNIYYLKVMTNGIFLKRQLSISKSLVSTKKFYHKKYSCEISKL